MPCCISAPPPKSAAADPAVRNARETLVAALFTAADNEITAKRTWPGESPTSTPPQASTAARPGWMCCADVCVNCRHAEAEVQPCRRQWRRQHLSLYLNRHQGRPRHRNGRKPLLPSRPCNASARSNRIYPPRALEQLVSGWVELQFTVASRRNGARRSGDGLLAAAVPLTRAPLPHCAAGAIKPVMRDGEAVPQRAHVRMRFTATDQKR